MFTRLSTGSQEVKPGKLQEGEKLERRYLMASDLMGPLTFSEFMTAEGNAVEAPTVCGPVVREVQTISVTTTADSGEGSLRDAIEQANRSFANTTIDFQLSADDNSIVLQSALPPLSSPGSITIDGGSSGDGAAPGIRIDGSRLTTPSAGLIVYSDNHYVSGISLQGFNSGIVIAGDGNQISNSVIVNTLKNEAPSALPTTAAGRHDDVFGQASDWSLITSPSGSDRLHGGLGDDAQFGDAGNDAFSPILKAETVGPEALHTIGRLWQELLLDPEAVSVGVYVASQADNNIIGGADAGNVIAGFEVGVAVLGNNTTVSHNEIHDNTIGVILDGQNNRLEHNTFYDNAVADIVIAAGQHQVFANRFLSMIAHGVVHLQLTISTETSGESLLVSEASEGRTEEANAAPNQQALRRLEGFAPSLKPALSQDLDRLVEESTAKANTLHWQPAGVFSAEDEFTSEGSRQQAGDAVAARVLHDQDDSDHEPADWSTFTSPSSYLTHLAICAAWAAYFQSNKKPEQEEPDPPLV